MKIISILFTFFLIPSLAFPQFHLSGETPASFNGRTVYLYYRDNDIRVQPVLQDSTVIIKRQFSFSAYMSQPAQNAVIGIKIGKEIHMNRLVLEQGMNRAVLKPVTTSQVFNIEMPGSRSAELMDKLHGVMSEAFVLYRGRNVVRGDIQLPETESREMYLESLEVLKAYPSLYLSLLMLYEYSQYGAFLNDEERILATLDSLDSNVNSTELATALREKMRYSLNARKKTQTQNP